MTQCTLFLSVPTLESLYDRIEDALPEHTLSINHGDGVIRALAEREQSLVIRLIDARLDADRFNGAINGLMNAFAPVKTTHDLVKTGLMGQIRLFTTVALIAPDTLETEFEEALLDRLSTLGYRVGGLFLTPGGDLYTGRGELVLNTDGVSDLDDYTFSTFDGGLDHTVEAIETNEARKQRSNEILLQYGLPISPTLPPIVGDDKVELRSREEVIERATGILIASLYGEFVRDSNVESAREKILSPLFADDPDYDADIPSPFGLQGAWDIMTPNELAFMANDKVTLEDTARFIWRYECYWVALWALGLVDHLSYPDTICDVSSMIGFLKEAGSMAAFSKRAKLRRAADILDEADLIYRYDWACVNAALNGHPAPGGLESGVVRERHRMLNWLIRYRHQEWDEVTTDT